METHHHRLFLYSSSANLLARYNRYHNMAAEFNELLPMPHGGKAQVWSSGRSRSSAALDERVPR